MPNSPPFVRFASAASDDGSYNDYDDGDVHMNGSGRSNSPPDGQAAYNMFSGTAAAAAGSGSAGSSAPKPKRKRSMIACKNCNERRVRCDGATSG